MPGPMSDAYCTLPATNGYCAMPPAAITRPAAHHTQTAGLGDGDMLGISILIAVAVLSVRDRIKARWAK